MRVPKYFRKLKLMEDVCLNLLDIFKNLNHNTAFSACTFIRAQLRNSTFWEAAWEVIKSEGINLILLLNKLTVWNYKINLY